MVRADAVENPGRPVELLAMIEPEQPFRHDARLMLGNAVGLPGADRFVPRTVTQSGANILLRDVVFDPKTGLLFYRGEILRWASYPCPPDEEAAARRRAAAARPAPSGRLAFCGFNRHWNNWFHWLTQCVPANVGYTTSEAWRDGVLLLPSGIDADRMKALDLANIDPPAIEWVDPDHALVIDRVMYSTLLAHQFGPSPFCRQVFRRMLSGPRPGPSARHNAVYVWRADAKRRPMLNEIGLVEVLIARGIEPVVASSLSIDEKIAKFRNAHLVVGAHGAGMANIVFCPPGSVVYELFPEHWLGSIAGAGINLLAQQQGLHYWLDAHPVLGTWEEYAHNVPWAANLALIKRRLDEIVRTHGLMMGPLD